jgi:hypothetical protein
LGVVTSLELRERLLTGMVRLTWRKNSKKR